MKLLLDTHTFLWWDSEPGRLSSKALALCQDRANTVLLSVECMGDADQVSTGQTETQCAFSGSG